MDPITVGIAAIAALLLNACGGDDSSGGKGKADDSDASTAGTGGSGGISGTGGRNSTGGSAGLAGSGGAAGNGGSGGVDGGTDSGGMDGADGSSYVDGTIPDGGNQASVPYHFGMIYGSGPVEGFRGTGMLYFSDPSSCQLLGGTFDGELQSGGQVGLSVDLTGNQSINFCASDVSLPLAGGIFDGVSWLLTNRSSTLTSKQSYEITACSSQNDGGAVTDCSGALEMTIP